MVDPDTARANAASRSLPDWTGTVDDDGKVVYRMDGETRRQIAATPATVVTLTVRRFLDIEGEDGSRDPGLLETHTSADSSLDYAADQLERAAQWYERQDEGRSVHRMAFAARIARAQADLLRATEKEKEEAKPDAAGGFNDEEVTDPG